MNYRFLVGAVLVGAAVASYFLLLPASRQAYTPEDSAEALASNDAGVGTPAFSSGAWEEAGETEKTLLVTHPNPLLSVGEKPSAMSQTDESGAVESVFARARMIEGMFQNDPAGLAMRVEEFMARNEVDREWAPQATSFVQEWFDDDTPYDQHAVHAECVAEACYVDLVVSYTDYLKYFRGKANGWSSQHIDGFLPTNFVVPVSKNLHRLYVFRDSIDPREL